MPFSTMRLRLAALALLCLPLPLVAGEEPPPVPDDTETSVLDPAPAWRSLRFAAEKLTGSVITTLRLSSASMADLEAEPYAQLRDTPDAFTGTRLLRLELEGEFNTLLGSSGTQARVWFDTGNGQVLLRERTRRNAEGTSKIHRFGARGASRLRLQPGDSRQAQRPVAEWSRRTRKFYPYDLQQTGCRTIEVPALLLYRITEQPTDSRHCVFHDDALYRVRLEAQGGSLHRVRYTLETPGGQRQVEGPRRLERFALQIEPLSPRADIEDFELLELRGKLAIDLDPEYRIPVQISGSRSGAGELTIQLEAASLGSVGD